jgi:hypothetical protein
VLLYPSSIHCIIPLEARSYPHPHYLLPSKTTVNSPLTNVTATLISFDSTVFSHNASLNFVTPSFHVVKGRRVITSPSTFLFAHVVPRERTLPWSSVTLNVLPSSFHSTTFPMCVAETNSNDGTPHIHGLSAAFHPHVCILLFFILFIPSHDCYLQFLHFLFLCFLFSSLSAFNFFSIFCFAFHWHSLPSYSLPSSSPITRGSNTTGRPSSVCHPSNFHRDWTLATRLQCRSIHSFFVVPMSQ